VYNRDRSLRTCREHLVDERDGVEPFVVEDVALFDVVVGVFVALTNDIVACSFGAPRPRLLVVVVVLLLVPGRQSRSSSERLHREHAKRKRRASERARERRREVSLSLSLSMLFFFVFLNRIFFCRALFFVFSFDAKLKAFVRSLSQACPSERMTTTQR
jgi:hypothetical protein